MPKKEFESIKSTLIKDGIHFEKSFFHDEAFGSWYITIAGSPSFRIVYDGRDRLKYLERFDGQGWKDILFDKTKSGKHIISKLKQEILGT